MPSLSALSSKFNTIKYLVISFVMAVSLWYVVVGSEQVEAQVEIRLDYKGQPANLVVREGQMAKVTARLRGPAELLRGLHNRDLGYTVDLSSLKRGANVLPLTLEDLGDFKAYEVVDVTPSRLILDVDALMERQVPLQASIVELPAESPFRLTHILLDPTVAKVTGPEGVLRNLEALTVRLDPNLNLQTGAHVESLAIVSPEHVEVSPPVATLRYTLALKTTKLSLQRVVQAEALLRDRFAISPTKVQMEVEVPEGRAKDAEYLAAIRVVVRPPDTFPAGKTSQDMPILVVLPSGSRLVSVDPSVVTVRMK